MYKLKQLKRLALTNEDVFLADLSTMRFRYACHSFVVRNAAIFVEEEGKTHKLIPFKGTLPRKYHSGYERASIKFGGITSKSNSFAIKIDQKRKHPDFVYAVLEFEKGDAPFLGFSVIFSGERTLKRTNDEIITAEALLGIGYLKDVEDVEAAFALGEKVAQGKIFDILDDTADDDDDDGVITIKIGDK